MFHFHHVVGFSRSHHILACKSNSYSCKQILWLYIPTFGYIKCRFIRISPEFKDGLHMISFFEFQCWHIHDRHLLCHVIKVGYHSEMNKCYSLIIWDFISFYSLKQKGSRCKQNESNCRGVLRENLKNEALWDQNDKSYICTFGPISTT